MVEVPQRVFVGPVVWSRGHVFVIDFGVFEKDFELFDV